MWRTLATNVCFTPQMFVLNEKQQWRVFYIGTTYPDSKVRRKIGLDEDSEMDSCTEYDPSWFS